MDTRDPNVHHGIWRNGKRTVTGCWFYDETGDTFVVELDSYDRITGTLRRKIVYGDSPEWGNWKLER